MFTGIVSDLGRVRAVRPGSGRADTRFEIETRYPLKALWLGASIACSGPCLTVVARGRAGRGTNWFAVEASAETLACTALGRWRADSPVNLERAMTAGAAFDGHIVTGHVDAVTGVLARRAEGGSVRFKIALPAALSPYVAAKGSVALDGVSLTVNEVGVGSFGVNIVRHTAERTSFGRLRAGDRVNMEVDLLARYVERQMAARFARRRR